MSGLDGKVALVTGAGRGVGRATAIQLAEAGALVALLARSRDDLEGTAERIRDIGASGLVIRADLAELDRLPEVLRQVIASLGTVQILINNAVAAEPLGEVLSLEPAAWATAIDVNVVAPAALSFALLPAMLEQGWGRVVNLSSGVVEEPGEMLRANAYVTSKAALEAHSLNLAAELANTGVTVNVFRPGAVRTDLFALVVNSPANIGTPELREWAVRSYKEDELISPEDSARSLLAHLRTDANGQVWDVSDDL
jgi:NAD(P)-dependent dehydrogenase (short-subunit alcohol dehydrogenase family)